MELRNDQVQQVPGEQARRSQAGKPGHGQRVRPGTDTLGNGCATAVGHRGDDLTSAAKFEGVQREHGQPDPARPQGRPDRRRCQNAICVDSQAGLNSSSDPKSFADSALHTAR